MTISCTYCSIVLNPSGLAVIVDPEVAGIDYTPAAPWPVLGWSHTTIPPSSQARIPDGLLSAQTTCADITSPCTTGKVKKYLFDKPSYTYFQRFRPVARAGYSIGIYHVDLVEANQARRDLGLPELKE